jgi:hypothetical protein
VDGAFVLPGTGPEPTVLGRDGLDFVPQNASFDVELRFTTRERVDDVVEVHVRNGSANRTRIPVNVSAGERVTLPFTVEQIRREERRQAHIVAVFPNTSAGGNPDRVGAQFQVVPQPRAQLLSPPNHRADDRRERGDLRDESTGHRLVADWDEEVPVEVCLENPWDEPTGLLPVQVRSDDQVVASTEVASLAPGAVREVTIGTVDRTEIRRPDFAVADHVRRNPTVAGDLQLSLGRDGGEGTTSEAPEPPHRDPLYNYTWPGESLRRQQRTAGSVEFRRGIQITDATANLTLGEPSRVTLEVRHHGGEPPQHAVLDLRVHPIPDLAYGVTSVGERRFSTTLNPGESRFVNISFTPRVGAPHQVEATVTVGGDQTRSQRRVPLENPVDLEVVGDPVRRPTLGETVEATVSVQAPAGVSGAIDWAGTVPGATRRRSGGTSFSSLITKQDLAAVTSDPTRVGGDTPTAENVTLQATGKVATDVAVIPLLRVDEIVHPAAPGATDIREVFQSGRVDYDRAGRPQHDIKGVLALRVQEREGPTAGVFAPPALVLLGVAGVEVHRRWYVR